MESQIPPKRQGSPLGVLRNRFRRSTDTESEQATVRLIAATAGLLYFLLAWRLFPDTAGGTLGSATLLFVGYVLFSLVLLSNVLTSPGRSVPRRLTGMLTDVAVISFGMHLSAVLGALLYPAYFLVIFGNGFRYGIRYVYTATALCSGAFALMIATSDYWTTQAEVAVALLIGLLALPLYVSVFMQRANAALKRAEETQRASRRLHQTLQHELAEDSDPESQTDGSGAHKVLVLARDISDRHHLIQYLSGWNTDIEIARTTATALFELVSAVRQNSPFQSALVDSRQLELEPLELAAAVRGDALLDSLSLIHVGPVKGHDEENQLLAAGYSYCLDVPVDKTLLFNALHSTPPLSGLGDQQSSISRIIDHRSGSQRAMPSLDILLAGHDPQNDHAARQALERAGHTVHAVTDGEQALEALGDHQFDLAIVDQKLPLMSALQVIKLHRFMHMGQSDMPFIVINDDPGSQAGKTRDEGGGDAWIAKPIRADDLVNTVAALISAREKSVTQHIPETGSACKRKAAVELRRAHLPSLDGGRLQELEELGVEPAFVDTLIAGFLHETQEILQEMAQALASERYARFTDLAQAIKGSAANIGAVVLYELSACACRLTSDQFPQEAGRLLGEIEDAFGLVDLSLQEYLQQRTSDASRV